MSRNTLILAAAAALALSTGGAFAQQQGSMSFGVGLGTVSPKSDNGTLAGANLDIGDDTQLTLTFEYFIADNLGIELLAASPFTHDLSLGGTDIGEVEHLPPTLSLQYHFPTAGAFKPLIGAGVNYTAVLDVDSPVGDVDLDNSFGLAAHAGVDYQINPNGALRVDARWIDIDLDAKLNGSDIGTAHVDPWVFGISYIYSF